jgi:hypothetical protein
MSESAPILFVIGLEGHIYIAEALGRELNRPLIAIATCQRVMEMMTPERVGIFQKIYSFPDFYLDQIDGIRRLSRQELDNEQRTLERELGVGCSALYTSYDRTLRWLGKFRKIRNWQLCNVRFVRMIFNETQPAFVHNGVAIFLQHVINDICRRKDIPYVRAFSNRSGGTVMYHADGHFVGMKKYFDALTRSGEKALDPQKIREADEKFNSFVQRPTVPQYTVAGSALGLNIPLLRKKIGWALRREHLFPSQKVKDVDRAMNIETPPHMIALHALRTAVRRLHLKLLNIFDKTPDLSVPFIYVPLHYAPEIADMYFGADYDHHEAFISYLSKHIPSDCQLYVKDHVSMWGRRPAYFYQNLSMLYNVKIIDPAVSTFDLIKAARATLTVTGTAGWEAYLIGRPVVVLGDVFYNFLPGVLHCPVNRDFFKNLTDYLENFKASEKDRRNAWRAYYACSFPNPYVYIGETTTRQEAAEMAARYAADMHSFIRKFSDELGGKFPADLVGEDTRKSMKIRAVH